ncbi:MAG: adenosylmethionine decarboxylase [Elusimicrobiales bacterium]|jgi:spermidine synthase|nr:adenosylmethionine decarboxylase [Elusimicrobiales bacterium]
MKSLGQHLVVELYDCPPDRLAAVDGVQETMVKAARAAKATIIDSIFHHFQPHGVSGVVVIAESHFAIHTWPEHGYAAIDLFTCGNSTRPWEAFKVVKRLFKAGHFSVMKMERGLLPR